MKNEKAPAVLSRGFSSSLMANYFSAACLLSPQGVIRLSWRIVQAPLRLIDYVVAHERVHLTHRNHTRAFWETLGRVMHDYDTRRAALRALGPRLEW